MPGSRGTPGVDGRAYRERMGRHDARRTLGQLVVVDPDQPAWIRWVRRAAPYAPSGLWLVLIPWAAGFMLPDHPGMAPAAPGPDPLPGRPALW